MGREKGDISSAGLLKPPPALYALEMGNTKCYQEILKGRPDLSVTYGLRKRAVMTVAASKPDSFWLREAIKYGGDVNFDDHGSELKR